MQGYHSIDEEIKMETAVTLIIVGIAGLGVALAYTIVGPKIRQRYNNDTLRTRSA